MKLIKTFFVLFAVLIISGKLSAQTTVTLTPSQDVMISDYHTSTLDYRDSRINNSSLHAYTGSTSQDPHYVFRALLKFDFSSIPANSTITSAILTLKTYQPGHSGNNAGKLCLIGQPWDESTVSWNNQPSASTNYYTNYIPKQTSNVPFSTDVTFFTKNMWYSGTSNHGLMLMLSDETETNARLSFSGKDYPMYAPQLVITYTDPSVVTGVSINDGASMTVGPYETIYLHATVSPSTAVNQNVTWSSSNPAIASVDAATGKVTTHDEGFCTITVTTDDGGFTDSFALTMELTFGTSSDILGNTYTTLLVPGNLAGSNKKSTYAETWWSVGNAKGNVSLPNAHSWEYGDKDIYGRLYDYNAAEQICQWTEPMGEWRLPTKEEYENLIVDFDYPVMTNPWARYIILQEGEPLVAGCYNSYIESCIDLDLGGGWWLNDISGESNHLATYNYIHDPDRQEDDYLSLHIASNMALISGISVKCVKQDGSLAKSKNQTGIQEVKSIDFMVFPNPSAGNITIALNLVDSKAQSIEIVNIQGKIVYAQEVIDNNTDIDLNNITKGLYLVKVKSNNKYSVKKLVIK